MSQLNNFVSTHLGVIGAVIVVGCVVLVLMILMLFIQSSRIALLSERLDRRNSYGVNSKGYTNQKKVLGRK